MVDEQDAACRHILERVAAEKANLTKRALALGAEGLTEPPSTLDMLMSMMDVNTDAGTGFIQLWRQGSASAHVHYWVDDMRGNTGAFDIEWFHVAIQGAMLFINDAITLHQRRRQCAGQLRVFHERKL